MIYKDPDADRDYVFDWSVWLDTGATITSVTILSITFAKCAILLPKLGIL